MRDKAFNVAENPKYDAYQRSLGSMACKLFNKKSSNSAVKYVKQGICWRIT